MAGTFGDGLRVGAPAVTDGVLRMDRRFHQPGERGRRTVDYVPVAILPQLLE
jgi:hypothetical protein